MMENGILVMYEDVINQYNKYKNRYQYLSVHIYFFIYLQIPQKNVYS